MENLDDKKKVFVFLSCMPAVSDNETAAIIMTSLNYLDSFSKFLLDEMFKEEVSLLGRVFQLYIVRTNRRRDYLTSSAQSPIGVTCSLLWPSKMLIMGTTA